MEFKKLPKKSTKEIKEYERALSEGERLIEIGRQEGYEKGRLKCLEQHDYGHIPTIKEEIINNLIKNMECVEPGSTLEKDLITEALQQALAEREKEIIEMIEKIRNDYQHKSKEDYYKGIRDGADGVADDLINKLKE